MTIPRRKYQVLEIKHGHFDDQYLGFTVKFTFMYSVNFISACNIFIQIICLPIAPVRLLKDRLLFV